MNPETQGEVSASEHGGWRDYPFWDVIRKYWTTAVATLVVFVAATSFYTLGQTRIYETTSTIQFDPNPPKPLGKEIETVVDMGAGSYWNNREYYETQYKIIQSLHLAMAVVNELGLDRDARFLTNAPPNKDVSNVRVTAEEAAEILLARLKVEPVKESRLAVVRYEDADPRRAQRILSVLVDIYVAQNLSETLAATGAAGDWLRGQLEKLKGELESSEMALHDYKMNKNILSVAFDDQSNMLRTEMKQIDEDLTRIRTKREEYAARVAELHKVEGGAPMDLPSSELLSSPILQDLRRKYADASASLQALRAQGKGEKHPDVQAIEQTVDTLRSALLGEVRNVRGAIGRDLSVLQRQEGGLSGLLEQAKSQALELNLLEIEYKRLQRTKDNNEKLYALILEKTKESDLTRMLRVNNIRIVDVAMAPRGPIRPRVPLNIAIGLLLGGALGILAAMGRAMLDRTIKTPLDVEQSLRLPALGLLPIVAESGAAERKRRRRHGATAKPGEHPPELIVHTDPLSGIAEAARAIRTNLLFMAPDRPARTLLVTSASPSEGKTTVSCCIAIAMAQAGQRVLIVDCDLRRPRLHHIFGTGSDEGVTTSLLGEQLREPRVIGTSVPGLFVTPAGPIPPNPAELLHSARFKEFLTRVSAQFDKVIIDSPPILAVTDATILSTLVDSVVLVVRAFGTRKDVAGYALRQLRDVGASTFGVILNAVDFKSREYNAKYYQYYRGGYYGQTKPQRPSASPAEPAS